MRVFTNLLKEKEHGGITAQGEGDRGYKRLCNRRQLMAEDRGLQNVLLELCKLMKIFWTIPITSCSAEQSLSCLTWLNSYLHRTTGSKRLSTLALLDIQKHIMSDIHKIIDTFAKKSSRKLELCYS